MQGYVLRVIRGSCAAAATLEQFVAAGIHSAVNGAALLHSLRAAGSSHVLGHSAEWVRVAGSALAVIPRHPGG